MDDPGAVRPGQGVCNGERHPEHFRQRQTGPKQRAQSLTVYVLHDDEVSAVDRDDVVDGGDVRVIEGGGGAGLLQKALAPALVGPIAGVKELDGHVPAKPGVAGPVHLSHATRAHESEDLVGAQARSRCYRHGLCATRLYRNHLSMGGAASRPTS